MTAGKTMTRTKQITFIYEEPIVLKTVVKSELDHTPIGDGAGDLTELGRIDIEVGRKESGVIEYISGLHAEFESIPLGEVGQLLNTGVHVERPGAGEHAALQAADFAWAGVHKHLSRVWLRSVRRDRPAIRPDNRL